MSLEKNEIKFLTYSNIGETDFHEYSIIKDVTQIT